MRPVTILLSLIVADLVAVPAARAACNLIPVVGETFPSAQSGVRSGSVSSPIAAPGEVVKVTVNPACDGVPSSFTFAPGDVVKLRFISPAPGNPTTTIAGESVMVDPEDPSGRTVRFTVPDTDATDTGSPDGLAGPAEITVERGMDVVARIGALYQRASGCDLAEENVFKHFIVLPKPNDVHTQSTAPTRILMTVDGDNNLLIPLDHTGGTVLPAGPGAPIARLLRGTSTYPAFDGMATPGLSEALSTALTVTVPTVGSEELMRAFTINGRPLPPLLRLDDAGGVFGTSDADRSVLRVRRLDGAGNPIYDVTTRLSDDGMGGPKVGPIVINPAFTLAQCDPVPLRGLRSSTRVAAFVRDEFDETPLSNLNGGSGDGDSFDSVVHIVGTAAGGQSCALNTGQAVSELAMPGFTEPVLEVSNDLVAFTVSEAQQNGLDLDGNGDAGVDHIMRVFDATGAELTATNVAIDLSQRVSGRALVIAEPLVFARSAPGKLGAAGSEATTGDPFFLALSPAGDHLYVANQNVTGIDVFSRDAITGALTFVENEPLGLTPRSILVHPGGGHVYVALQDATTVFQDYSRNPVTGALTFSDEWNEIPAPGTPAPESIALSPAGDHIYLADFGKSRVFGFRLDAAGALQTPPFAFVVDDVDGVDGLAGAISVAVSPDGRHVYAAGFNEDKVAVFARDPATGLLTFVEVKIDGQDGVIDLSGPLELVVSPDGMNVYVSCSFIDATVVFLRNPTTGRLTFLQSVPDAGGEHLTVSPDGRNVYVARSGTGTIRVYGRNSANGSLGFVEETPSAAINVAVSPDGLHLYEASFALDTVDVFGVSQGQLRVFDTDALAYRPEAEVEATEAVVSGLRAGILTPEANVGASLNGDPDADDLVGQAYDGSLPMPGDRLKSLGVAANRIVISPDVVAVTVPEAKQNQAPGGAAGNPLNGDGDALDDVVFRQALPVPPVPAPQNLQVAADALGVSGPTLVIVTPESSEGPGGVGCTATSPAGGCDLDGDGDALDRVLRLHGPDGFVEIGRPVEEFVVGGHLIAFRSSEAAMNATGPGCRATSPPGGCDRNGDGDTLDAEMMIYDLAADALIATGQTAIPCSHTIPGCDARVPYKIKGDNVCFLTDELQQNTPPKDLDGDGFTDRIVVQCYHTRSRRLQRFPLCDTTSTVEVFPEEFVDNTVLNIRVSETALGYDVNGDLVLDDCVLFVLGDNDGDDSFDDADTCVEAPNVTQTDSDLDGLGDVCDPNAFCGDFVPPAPPVAPLAATACQRAIGKAAHGYLKQRASAVTKCLDGVAKGKLAGEATALCRGVLAEDGEVPPADPKTAAKIAKEATKLAATVAKKCADPEVAMLEACAAAASGLETCVVPAYAASAVAGSDLAYGSVAAIGDKADLACQRAVGGESRGYLTKVAQAMQQCLDKLNAGKIAGDPQVVCLGSLTPGGVALPTDPTTQKKLQKAEEKLRAKIAKKCGGTQLQSLDVCGGVATTPNGAGDCLACVGWRRSVESLRSAYGPLP